MTYFARVGSGFDVAASLAEIGEAEPQFPPNYIDAPDIKGRSSIPAAYRGLYETDFGPASRALLMEVLQCLKAEYYGEGFHYQNPIILACPPKGRVRPHRDHLASDVKQSAMLFQLAIQCDQRAYFRIGTSKARFAPGELWACDIGDRVHEMRNESDRWRIVMRLAAWPYAEGANIEPPPRVELDRPLVQGE